MEDKPQGTAHCPSLCSGIPSAADFLRGNEHNTLLFAPRLCSTSSHQLSFVHSPISSFILAVVFHRLFDLQSPVLTTLLMAYTSAYLTPPDLSPISPRMVPPTVRPRSGGDSRWQPYYPRARSLTPTSGLRSSRSTDSIPSTSSSNKTWPQPAPKSRYPYTAYDPASYAHQYTSPPERTEIGSKFYITPDPSPRPVRHARKASYPVPPTIDEEFVTHRYRAALPPTPPRTTSRASAGSEKSAPIPPCSIDAPHARQAFTSESLTFTTVYMPVPGSLPVDPTTLQWFTTELIRRASVPGGVLKLALSYMIRARSAALRACEAQVPAPISPPPSPLYPSHMDFRRSRSPCGSTTLPGPELADPRQMLLGALVLAQKFLIDAAYTSATWGKLSGLSASNVAAVERTLGTNCGDPLFWKFNQAVLMCNAPSNFARAAGHIVSKRPKPRFPLFTRQKSIGLTFFISGLVGRRAHVVNTVVINEKSEDGGPPGCSMFRPRGNLARAKRLDRWEMRAKHSHSYM
ncbi:hypothetical protein AG1IA_06543 [Rhizoctonia solani AG-1 IA]|uniref:Cyclin domain-containing protein n=1 Tax=Thanatephorus cucumeris (strain AG1-IA) TaxID=983506 RepID=L8WRQ1_THACA|nr:hypothetical protein AG1IA_06543 [Rhizoctonia solani AG-1 IA]